jgi:hypothetical protein
MSDPPVTTVPVTADVQGRDGEKGEGLVHVKEGYFRYIDVLFEWCKYMNPWQVSQLTDSGRLRGRADSQKNAVKALLNGEALTHPDHPLHQPGQDGIELYISKLPRPLSQVKADGRYCRIRKTEPPVQFETT